MTVSYRALLILFDHERQSAGELGARLWGDSRRGRVSSSNGGGDYAAQMLLGRLRKKDLVRVSAHSVGCDASLWELTSKGRAVAENIRKAGIVSGATPRRRERLIPAKPACDCGGTYPCEHM